DGLGDRAADSRIHFVEDQRSRHTRFARGDAGSGLQRERDSGQLAARRDTLQGPGLFAGISRDQEFDTIDSIRRPLRFFQFDAEFRTSESEGFQLALDAPAQLVRGFETPLAKLPGYRPVLDFQIRSPRFERR